MRGMFDLIDSEEDVQEVVDIMGKGNLDLSNVDISMLEDFVEEGDTDISSVDDAFPEIAHQPPIPTIACEQYVPNTYRDLLDSENSWQLISEDQDNPSLLDREIHHLLDLSLKIDYPTNIDEIIEALEQGTPIPTPSGCDKSLLKLSLYIDKMPHGIVDKQVAGIGATTLEINAKRNSIIVTPTKMLAYNKWVGTKARTLYVGGKVNEERDLTSNNEILNYLADKKIEYKKFLVVADSLSRLLNIIKEEQYQSYFLMIDEVDMIQSESNYRPKLESLIDYYFQFPPENRCLVTATMREFSNPRLQQECKFKFTWTDVPKRNIKLCYTDNLDALTAQQIQSINNIEKIVIAFNSIRHCKNIIKLLPEEIRKECAILCSDSSKDDAADHYKELTPENRLPQRINFITSCYFAGVDIEDSYHLITVSNARQNYQMLSLEKMTQIYGRCRVQDGILSDTIIHNQQENWQDELGEDCQTTLLKQASAILKLQETASELSKSDQDLEDLFGIVKTAIREKGVVFLSKKEAVRLTRKDSFNNDVPAYMNIDYLVERKRLRNTVYDTYNHLKETLEKLGHQVNFENKYGSIPLSDGQKKIEETNKKELQESQDAQLSNMITELRAITKSKLLTQDERKTYKSQKGCSTFIYRFYELQKYADADVLIDQLWEIRHSDKRAYNNLHNAVIFWALDDKHPFKRELFNVFKVGEKYRATEIYELIAPLVKYHLHKTIKQRTSVSLLKALFLVERPKDYLIKAQNPLGFKKRGSQSIPKTEENLLAYFKI